MNQVTQQFKQEIFGRGTLQLGLSNAAYRSNQQRFLHHFQSINPQALQTSLTPIINTKQIEQNYSQVSIIDRILLQNEDTITMQAPLSLVKHPPVPEPSLAKSVRSITKFFESQPPSYFNIDLSQDILELDTYSRLVSSFGRVLEFVRELEPKSIPKFQSKLETEPIRRSNIKEVHEQAVQTGGTGLKRSDVILMQILKERKRKGTVGDYFGSLQLKLMDLLQYILQDEDDFRGMTTTQKMKQVLRKLEYFKGRQVQGQSKINLLRIFFEEFRNLKQQRQEAKPSILAQQNRQERATERIKAKKIVKKGSESQNNLAQYSKNGRKSGARSAKQDQWMGELI